jgi:MFS family permease
MIAIYLAFGGGQFVLALGDPAGATLFLVAALVFSASILPIVLTRATAPSTPPTPRLPLRRIYETAPLGLAGALVGGLAIGAVQSIGPQFASELGLSVTRISQFMGTFFLSGLLLQWPAGHLSDRMDRRRVLGAMALVTALACSAIALVEVPSFALLIGLAALGGGTMATIYPLSVAHANDRLHAESVIAITSTLLLASGIGAVTGPMLASTVMLAAGAPGLFYTTAVAAAALAGYAAFRIARYAPVEQERYVTVAQTTPVVLELDPRAPHE